MFSINVKSLDGSVKLLKQELIGCKCVSGRIAGIPNRRAGFPKSGCENNIAKGVIMQHAISQLESENRCFVNC